MSDLSALLKTQRRPWGRYVTPTLLKGYLAGDSKCLFQLWFSANYDHRYQPMTPEDAERMKQWNIDHDRMIKARADQLRADHFNVKTEHRLKIKAPGRVTIGGRLDILATKAEFVHVWDGKTGRRRDADHEQVRLYLALLPITDQFSGNLWDNEANEYQGFVEYQAGVEDVELHPDETLAATFELCKLTLDPEVPPTTPSQHECMKCKIAGCPDREKPSSGTIASW